MAAKIIQFKPREEKHSIVYENLAMAVNGAADNYSLMQYEEVAGALAEKMTPEEIRDITEKIRVKRLEITAPKKKAAQIADKPGVYMWYPEMGDAEPVGCQLTEHRGYYSGHVYIDSPFPLKGRGIRFMKQYSADDFANGADNPRVGQYEYCVTERVFEILKQKYSIAHEVFLD